MTDIRKLMEECAPFPWTGVIAHATDWNEHDGTVPLTIHFDGTCRDENGDDEDFILTAVNALPAVLEYMDGGHHSDCPVYHRTKFCIKAKYELIPECLCPVCRPDLQCTCGYDALAKALGVEE